jgi:hypothetical protein
MQHPWKANAPSCLSRLVLMSFANALSLLLDHCLHNHGSLNVPCRCEPSRVFYAGWTLYGRHNYESKYLDPTTAYSHKAHPLHVLAIVKVNKCARGLLDRTRRDASSQHLPSLTISQSNATQERPCCLAYLLQTSPRKQARTAQHNQLGINTEQTSKQVQRRDTS